MTRARQVVSTRQLARLGRVANLTRLGPVRTGTLKLARLRASNLEPYGEGRRKHEGSVACASDYIQTPLGDGLGMGAGRASCRTARALFPFLKA